MKRIGNMRVLPLASPAKTGRKRFVLGEYLLVPDRRTLHRNGEAVHLANKPFHVLLYLIEHRDRLVTRAELMDRFWDGRDVYEDTMRKCIGAIRKALDDRQDHPRFIETRWAEGYRYVGPLAVQFVEEDESPSNEHMPEDGTNASAPNQARNVQPPAAEPVQLKLAPPPAKTRRAAAALVSVAALCLVLTFFWAFFWNRNGAKPAVENSGPARSIVVLPLKNLTGDPAQDYFGDGVAESLINELAKARDLKVIARNSAFAFKGKEVDVREIGRRLGVAAVLEGSLRRDADTVRVTVRLVSAEDGRVLWTGDTTRPMKDIIAVQDEIGCSVAESLKTVLCCDPNYKPGANNLAAYEAYLKARDRRLKGDPKQAAALFEQAVATDPNYALAWAGLAEAYTLMEVNSIAPPRSTIPRARECAVKAIALDASLASPYAALGLMAAFSDRDWAAGENYFQQALANNPNHSIAHAWYANTLLAQGKFAAAEAEYLRARELDPLNPGFLNNLAETYHYWRQSDRCLAAAANALELDPGNEWARFNQAKCYCQQGRYDEALRVPVAANYKHLVDFVVFAQSGRTKEAREVLPLVIKDYGRVSPFVVAIAHALLGDKEAAFAWLRKSADAQQADLASLKIEPAFDGMRDDPRYAELLRRVGLTP